MYDDHNLFKIRAEMFRDVVIPCLRAQTDQGFLLSIMIDRYTEELREILDYPFIAIDERKQIREVAMQHDCQLMTSHGSDDWLADNYVATCKALWQDCDVETLLIHFDFDMVDLYTGEVMEYTKPKGHISGAYTVCNKDYKYTPHMMRHVEMGSVADKVIEMPKGYVKYYQHNYNVLKLRNQGREDERHKLYKDMKP